jgi:hypothetical protein
MHLNRDYVFGGDQHELSKLFSTQEGAVESARSN